MYSLKLTKEEQLRDEAVRAAQELFQQFGLHKTTMEDIAKAMGRGKSTLYYYYKSKEEIFNAVLMKEIDEVFVKNRKAIEKVTTAEEKLKTYFMVTLKAVKSKVNLYKIIRGELKDDITQVSLLIRKFNSQEVQIVKEILSLGIENNEFDSSLNEDVELLAYSTVSAFRSLALDLAFEDKFPNWDERLNILISLVIKGMKK
jgi:AcrR family transcriptional regulator